MLPMSLSEQLNEHVSACFTGLWVQSHEHEDALADIARLCGDENWRLAVWDIDQGLQLPGRDGDATSEAGAGDPLAAVRAINALAAPDSSAMSEESNGPRARRVLVTSVLTSSKPPLCFHSV